jgi:hypothetical protein
MNLESSYRTNTYTPPAEEKKPWKLPENFKERLDASGFLGLLFGLVFLITALVFHGFMVPNDKIPHADPTVVNIFMALAGIVGGLGALILLGRITVFLVQVATGKRKMI